MSEGGTQIRLAVVDKLGTWLSAQPITNILLVLQLAMIAGGGYATLKYIVPVHLSQIQDGYQKQDEQHTKQIEAIIKSHEAENARAFGIIESMMKQQENGGAGIKPNHADVAGKDTPL